MNNLENNGESNYVTSNKNIKTKDIDENQFLKIVYIFQMIILLEWKIIYFNKKKKLEWKKNERKRKEQQKMIEKQQSLKREESKTTLFEEEKKTPILEEKPQEKIKKEQLISNFKIKFKKKTRK